MEEIRTERNDKTWLGILIGIVLITILLIIFPPLKFTMYGNNPYATNFGTEYKDPGYSLKLFGNICSLKLVFLPSLYIEFLSEHKSILFLLL